MRKDTDVVIWSKKSPWTPGRLVQSLRRQLRGRAEKVYLFGSHSRGGATTASDIDLFIVANTKKPWPVRGRDYFDLFDRYGAVDILVYTPQEWKQMLKNPTPFFRHARKAWKEIF